MSVATSVMVDFLPSLRPDEIPLPPLYDSDLETGLKLDRTRSIITRKSLYKQLHLWQQIASTRSARTPCTD